MLSSAIRRVAPGLRQAGVYQERERAPDRGRAKFLCLWMDPKADE